MDIVYVLRNLIKHYPEFAPLALAESCTGGLVAAKVTSVAGSSNWFDRGYVTYNNQAKSEILGVSEFTLYTYTAVSEQVALEMLSGLFMNTQANIAGAITGIAGPGGGTENNPVGTVYIAWGIRGYEKRVQRYEISGSRIRVRKRACEHLLHNLCEEIQRYV